MRVLIVVLAALVAGARAEQPPAPWGANRHPTDVPKRHVEEIAEGRKAYTVRQGGTMDGTNCRSPLGVGMMDGPPVEQTWESNRAVRLENVGETDVVNPWLSNGRNNFRTLDEIVDSAVRPGMTDREKAFALWHQEIRHRYHWEGDNTELMDPVKVFNVYGHNTCGNDSICLAGLWRRAGLKVAPACVVGHCVTQAFFDGRWNLFDGDMHSMYLLRDNRTVASEQDLVRDHDLVKRSHTQGILNPDNRATDEWQASIYVFEGEPAGTRNSVTGTSMNMVLRPGEAITWRWGHADPVKYHGGSRPRYPDTICNGLWEYCPDFSRDLWKQGAAMVEGVRTSGGELTAEPGATGAVVWTIRSPYVLVGGRIEVEGSGVKFALSWDGKSWMEAGPDLDGFFPPGGPARYEYQLRCELDPEARLRGLRIVNDLQMAPLALPAMSVGANRFVYTDEAPAGRKVRITHEWVERSATRPPAAPAAPLFPRPGGEADPSALVFRWEPARDPDGDRIADYHFELSDRPDMRWPLSTNFAKLIGKTADRGKAQYTLPYEGLLAPGRKVYWRVRARDEHGVWGPWSATWSFTPRGPSPPLNLTLAVDPERGTGILRWQPNPAGERPVRYRIYGSDEKGFTASDVPFKVNIGASKEIPSTQPANFVAEVGTTEAAVIGPEVRLPNANHAHYRVVAVDGQGRRSGPSDAAEAPRPVLCSRPVTAARVGSEYRCQLSAVRSIGDVRTRVVDGRATMSYWDIEVPRFTLQQGPAWLKIDAGTGLLSGTPDSPGSVPVVVAVTIDRDVRTLDRQALSWGIEKVLSTGRQRVGVATQKFTIEVLRERGR
jgi:putative Ig domain-containing protein